MLLIKEGYVYDLILHLIDIFHGVTAPSGPRSAHQGFTITFSYTTLGRIPLDK